MGIIPIFKDPATSCFSSLIISFILCVEANTILACSINLYPMSVGTTGCRLRSKMITPRSSSNFLICILSVGCVTKHLSAAVAKCRNSSTATTYSNCVSVIINLSFNQKNPSSWRRCFFYRHSPV